MIWRNRYAFTEDTYFLKDRHIDHIQYLHSHDRVQTF